MKYFYLSALGLCYENLSLFSCMWITTQGVDYTVSIKNVNMQPQSYIFNTSLYFWTLWRNYPVHHPKNIRDANLLLFFKFVGPYLFLMSKPWTFKLSMKVSFLVSLSSMLMLNFNISLSSVELKSIICERLQLWYPFTNMAWKCHAPKYARNVFLQKFF